MYTNIRGKRAKELVSKGAALIDIRSPVEYSANTLLGATNIPFRMVSSLTLKYKKNQSLIFFGDEGQPELTKFASYASQMGFTKLYVLQSMNSWQDE